MARQRVYVPGKVKVNIGGADVGGFAPGTFLTMERSSDNTQSDVGAGGDPAHTKSSDLTGTIELTLLQTSDTNRTLSGIQALDDFTQDITFFDMTVTDPSGGTVAQADSVHIKKAAPITLADGQTAKTWNLFADELIYTDAPPGFVEVAGKVGQISNAVNTVKAASDKLKELFG